MGLKIGLNTAAQNLKYLITNSDGNATNMQNIQTIADYMCHLRGAALKIGQMISIQDNEYVPREVQEIFAKVRQNADFMPFSQVQRVLSTELGKNWRELFQEFDEQPSASASIGQVHDAVTKDGRSVCVKVQYPNIHKSIDNE